MGTGTENSAAALLSRTAVALSLLTHLTDTSESQDHPQQGVSFLSQASLSEGLGTTKCHQSHKGGRLVAHSAARDEPRRDTSTNSIKTKPNPPAKPSSLHSGFPSSVWRQRFPGSGKRADKGRWWDMETMEWDQMDWASSNGLNQSRENFWTWQYSQASGGREKNAGVCLRSTETQQLLSWHSELRIKLACQWSHTRIETAQAGAAAGSRMWIYFILWLSSPSDANCCSSD